MGTQSLVWEQTKPNKNSVSPVNPNFTTLKWDARGTESLEHV